MDFQPLVEIRDRPCDSCPYAAVAAAILDKMYRDGKMVLLDKDLADYMDVNIELVIVAKKGQDSVDSTI